MESTPWDVPRQWHHCPHPHHSQGADIAKEADKAAPCSSTLRGKGRGAPKAVTWLVTARSLISPFPRDRSRYSFISKGLEIPTHRSTRRALRNFATARVGFEREGLAAPATASEGTETRATSAPVPAPGCGHGCPCPFLPPLAAKGKEQWGTVMQLGPSGAPQTPFP